MTKEVQKIKTTGTLTCGEPSIKLMECISNLSHSKNRNVARNEYKNICKKLFLNGNPNFKSIVQYPKITELISQIGEIGMQKIVFLIIKRFCESFNVIRNMNEDQMIDCASDLLFNCGNYRLEDYIIFFESAKNGKYGRVLDHIDSQVIFSMLERYDRERQNAGEFFQECEIKHYDGMGTTERSYVPVSENEIKIFGQPNTVKAVLSDIKSEIKRQLQSKR